MLRVRSTAATPTQTVSQNHDPRRCFSINLRLNFETLARISHLRADLSRRTLNLQGKRETAILVRNRVTKLVLRRFLARLASLREPFLKIPEFISGKPVIAIDF